MKIITVSSLKGGVGKTTLSIYLGQAIAKLFPKSKILKVDLDHNNNLTDYYLRDESLEIIEENSIAKYLTGARDLDSILTATGFDNIFVIPATPKLSKTAVGLSWDAGLITRFRKHLRNLEFDYIIIDTPPALCLELNLGIHASDLVLSPIGFSRWNIQGFQEIEEVVSNANDSLENGKIKILPVRTMVSEKKSDKLDELDISFAKTYIPKSESIASAVDQGKPLTEKNSFYFEQLAKEIK
ncbi:ParA family protein [Leptospira bandrabouensis]|uniref:ParA family protein n=1 Tax=Leptospira bandrabouensis TaxID=2484903 RepID=UPI00223E53FD|nr:ParA family protein [Leptospira bandrabouensis]MCW7460135.1 ParA family protein [Leptospira bandrabouensis]MCW7479348.1 ParA family protein [Leptospira bandrabouensis]MCW7487030.1 ParA family protein [Leptospira bandrabouensis]